MLPPGKKNEPAEKNAVYSREIIGILQLMSPQIYWIVSNGSSDLQNCVKLVLRSAELCLARKKLQHNSSFLVLSSTSTEEMRTWKHFFVFEPKERQVGSEQHQVASFFSLWKAKNLASLRGGTKIKLGMASLSFCLSVWTGQKKQTRHQGLDPQDSLAC